MLFNSQTCICLNLLDFFNLIAFNFFEVSRLCLKPFDFKVMYLFVFTCVFFVFTRFLPWFRGSYLDFFMFFNAFKLPVLSSLLPCILSTYILSLKVVFTMLFIYLQTCFSGIRLEKKRLKTGKSGNLTQTIFISFQSYLRILIY